MTANGRDEVLRALDQAAASYRFAVQERSEGTVLSIADGVAQVAGLSEIRLDEMVRCEDGSLGLAVDLREEEVGVVLLDPGMRVRAGTRLRATGQVASVPVGEALLGRVLDPMGRPIDDLPAPAAAAAWPVERPAPAIHDRAAVRDPLLTGTTVVDAMFPVGRGQRELIIGDRGTGKSAIAIDAIINQRGTGVRCVYVCIGQKTSMVLSLLDALRAHDALAHTVVIVASSDAPPGARFLAPYAGCSIAEYFRDRGEHALLVLDDLTKHAIAYREMTLILRRPPGREAFPGDIFFIHSRLLERATQLRPELGGGSLTTLPIAETQAGRISDYIPTNLISITDGQLYLDPKLYDRGLRPAVDVGLSVSRVGGKTQSPAMKAVAGRLRLDTARFAEVEVFTRFGARVEEHTQALLVRGARIREVLKQPPLAPIPAGEQIAVLVALEEGHFDPLPVEAVRERARALRGLLRREHGDLLRSLELGGTPTDETRNGIRQAFQSMEAGHG